MTKLEFKNKLTELQNRYNMAWLYIDKQKNELKVIKKDIDKLTKLLTKDK